MSSVAGTPSPEPSTPPTSPAKSTPPSSPKKVANAAKKEEAKKAKEVAKEMEKVRKWRATQRGKIEKTIEKKAPGVKAILEKLSTAWDVVGLAEYQIRLLDNEEVSTPAQLDIKTKQYEEGPQMIKDFINWIKAEYSPDEEEKSEAGVDGGEMEVDELESKGDAASEKVGEEVVNGEKQNGDNDEGEAGDDDDDDDE
ncbi:hypothetical protein FFLO_03460 [Filobasidium floriforme]|uniref:Uncharacterized protein n=1 Tax=Filobasidium floriforme TaxID=5210 RepID=A0A8K0NQ99_9TREE|nr:hypothetical protein FFLO_03460 [Filobasidium floriforme]